MKIVHVLKRIETIDEDIRELRKMEKGLNRDKAFSKDIYISIEKQINILVNEKVKLMELKVENPPVSLVEQIEGAADDKNDKDNASRSTKNIKKAAGKSTGKKIEINSIDDIPMLTQDQIDAKISSIKINKPQDKSKDEAKTRDHAKSSSQEKKISAALANDDQGIKILDTVLEHGTLNKDEIAKTRDRKVKFFRENFPAE